MSSIFFMYVFLNFLMNSCDGDFLFCVFWMRWIIFWNNVWLFGFVILILIVLCKFIVFVNILLLCFFLFGIGFFVIVVLLIFVLLLWIVLLVGICLLGLIKIMLLICNFLIGICFLVLVEICNVFLGCKLRRVEIFFWFLFNV